MLAGCNVDHLSVSIWQRQI